MKTSGLRGRGGAGFPCGVKWGFIKPDEPKPVYLICNADESEPGTFKDRYIIHQDPHQLLEGMLISCFALNAHTRLHLHPRRISRRRARSSNTRSRKRARKSFLGKNILGTGFDVEIYVHRGAGAYICGEETGLIESLEGKRAYPRIKPPYFPAVLGLYLCPTIVNNVETLCHVKHIIAHGRRGIRQDRPAEQHRHAHPLRQRRRRQAGLFRNRSRRASPWAQLINEMAGGAEARPQNQGRHSRRQLGQGLARRRDRYKISRRITAKMSLEDIPMDFDSLAAAGSMAGSGGVIVLDDSRDMVWALNNINEFYAHESCGQCTPCREGSLWMKKITERMLAGGGVTQDPATLKNVADNIAGRTICAFGEACAWPTQSFVDKFPEEFAGARQKPVPPPLPPEYTSEELIAEKEIPTVPLAHDPGWEKAGAPGTI